MFTIIFFLIVTFEIFFNYSIIYFFFLIQVCKHKTLAASSKNTSFDSSSHYEDINVTSREYAVGDSSDGDYVHADHRMRYPKVLPDFPAGTQYGSGAERRLSLPPPMMVSAGVPEQSGSTKIPPPPPPRLSSTLGRKKENGTTGGPISVAVHQFDRQHPHHPEPIPEEHKSLVVPCVPNKVCPAVAVPLPSRKPPGTEPRIVIKASTNAAQRQPDRNQQGQPASSSAKRANIPRVVHPQNADGNKSPMFMQTSSDSDTGTIKRKKKNNA